MSETRDDQPEVSTDAVTKVARDLTEILRLHDALLTQAVSHGDDPDIPGGESMTALGNVANIEAWANYHDATERHELGQANYRRAYTSVIDEDPDEAWSAFQLIEFWSERWRAEHGAEYDKRPTIASEANFLRYTLNWAWDHELHWDEFAADIRHARLHLEDIIYAGKRQDRTRVTCDRENCPHPRLIRIVHGEDPAGGSDWYKCPACKHRFDADGFKKAHARMLGSAGMEKYLRQREAVATLVGQGRGLRTIRRWLGPPIEHVADRCTVCRRKWPPQEYPACPGIRRKGDEACGGELKPVKRGSLENVIEGYCDVETRQVWLWWPDLWRKHHETRTTRRKVAKAS